MFKVLAITIKAANTMNYNSLSVLCNENYINFNRCLYNTVTLKYLTGSLL